MIFSAPTAAVRSEFPAQDADTGEDERGTQRNSRGEWFAQQRERKEQRDDNAAFVDQGDGGDGAGLHRAIVENPGKRRGETGEREERKVASCDGVDLPRPANGKSIGGHQQEDDRRPDGEAGVGAQTSETAL